MKIPFMADSSVSVPLLMHTTTLMLLMSSLMASAAAASHHSSLLHISSISAAPATLPEPPLSSPATISAAPSVLPAAPEAALSPDITPLLPKGGAASPADSSLPIIPSSPSPPNPDYMMAPGPASGLEPSGALLPESAASGSGAVNLPAVVLCSLGLFFVSSMV